MEKLDELLKEYKDKGDKQKKITKLIIVSIGAVLSSITLFIMLLPFWLLSEIILNIRGW